MDVEKLIEAVRCFPCLWDVTSRNYKDVRARGKMPGKMLPKVGDGFTDDVCLKKWKNLRDHYVRELKKKKKVASGAKGPAFISCWPYFEMLGFLSDTVRHRGSYSNFSGEGGASIPSMQDVEEEQSTLPENEQNSMINDEVGSPHCESTSFAIGPTPVSSPVVTLQHKKRWLNRDEEVDKAICDGFAVARERWSKTEPERKNPDMHFGMEIGERLFLMTPRQKALAKVRIEQVLMEVVFPAEHYYSQPIPPTQPSSQYSHQDEFEM